MVRYATISCKTDNKKIATVTNKGVITPRAEGKTTVTVTIKQNKKIYTSKVQVIVLDPSVSITDIPQVFEEGLSYKLRGITMGIKNPKLNWSTSDSAIALVDSTSGELMAQGVGSTKLTLKDSNSGTKDSITIKIIEYKPIKISYDFKKGIPANASGRGNAKIEAVKKDGFNTVYISNRSASWEGI